MARDDFYRLAKTLEKEEETRRSNFRKMIKKDADSWNQWKIENPDECKYYNGIDIHGEILHDFDFSGISFVNVIFIIHVFMIVISLQLSSRIAILRELSFLVRRWAI